MRSELVVDVQPQETSVALLEDGRLMSLQKESRNIKFAVGDIYYGRIKKLMPGLNAAFVDIALRKRRFFIISTSVLSSRVSILLSKALLQSPTKLRSFLNSNCCPT